MAYILKDANGNIISYSFVNQGGDWVEIDDNDPTVVAFLNPPIAPPDPVVTQSQLQAQLQAALATFATPAQVTIAMAAVTAT